MWYKPFVGFISGTMHRLDGCRFTVSVALLALRVVLHSTEVSAFWSEFEFVSFKNFNNTDEAVCQYNVALKRIDRKNYGISGNVQFKSFPNVEVEGRVYYSAHSNGQYVRSPFKLPRMAVCDFVDRFYTNKMMKDLKEPVSDCPQIDGIITKEDICGQFENRKFTVRKYVFDYTLIPRMLQTGLYKAQFIAWDGDTVVCGSDFVARLF